MFDVPDTELAELILEDDRLLRFAIRFLRQVLFGEHTLPFKQGVRTAHRGVQGRVGVTACA